jgi:hypothetical protein
MDQNQLHDLIKNAPENTLRDCLFCLANLWFNDGNEMTGEKEITPEIISAVSDTFNNFGFYPAVEKPIRLSGNYVVIPMDNSEE